MSISWTEDFKTDSELASKTREILKHVQRTGRPLVVTVAGKPAAVLLDVNVFEKKLHTANLARLIAEAEASVRAGRTRPIEEFFRELDREKKIPRANRARRRTRSAKAP